MLVFSVQLVIGHIISNFDQWHNFNKIKSVLYCNIFMIRKIDT